MSSRRLVAVLACAAALACGKSRQQRAFEQLQSICEGLVAQQTTLAQAEQAMNSVQYESGFRCPTGDVLLAPLSGGTCPAQSASNPECAFFFEWQSTDPGLCNPQGGCCFLCEVRVMKGSITQSDAGASTPICASRWVGGQFCQL